MLFTFPNNICIIFSVKNIIMNQSGFCWTNWFFPPSPSISPSVSRLAMWTEWGPEPRDHLHASCPVLDGTLQWSSEYLVSNCQLCSKEEPQESFKLSPLRIRSPKSYLQMGFQTWQGWWLGFRNSLKLLKWSIEENKLPLNIANAL